MDRECEIGEGVVGPAHSADSLVMEAYPPHIRPHQVEYLKTLFRDVPDRGPERLASQLLRCLNMPSYSVSEEEIQEFLFHISIHGHNDDSKERARIAYALFMDYLDSPATKKQKIAAASGYKWTGTELDHFNVVFDLGYEIGHIIDQQPLSDRCAAFLDNHASVSPTFMELNPEEPTDFLEHMKFVYLKKGNEAAVDDLMTELLRHCMSSKFLIKTRYPMHLKMALRTMDQEPPTEATADVIAIRKQSGDKPRKIGLLIVEDKSYVWMNSATPTKAAEAQMFAEGIAVAQQPDWDINDPVYMLRVMGLQVTFYKAQFTTTFLRDVELGTRRYTAFRVRKLGPRPYPNEDDGLRGFDLSIEKDRRLIGTVLNSISISIAG